MPFCHTPLAPSQGSTTQESPFLAELNRLEKFSGSDGAARYIKRTLTYVERYIERYTKRYRSKMVQKGVRPATWGGEDPQMAALIRRPIL